MGVKSVMLPLAEGLGMSEYKSGELSRRIHVQRRVLHPSTWHSLNFQCYSNACDLHVKDKKDKVLEHKIEL